jgi:TonB family protein
MTTPQPCVACGAPVLKLTFCTDDSLRPKRNHALMGESTPKDSRRRYARPGEFELPDSVLETSSFKQRLGGELNSDHKSPAAPSRDSPPSGDLRAKGELRPSGELSPLRARPTPLAVEAHLNGDPNQYRRSPVTISRAPHFSGELNPIRRNPVSPVGEAPLRVDPNQYGRNPAPQTNRDAMVRRRVAARFELLPEPKSRWNRMGWSAAAQLAFLGVLLLSPVIFPKEMQTALKFDSVDLAQPITYVNPSPTPPPLPPPKIKPKTPPPELKPKVPKPKQTIVEPPELNPRQPHIFLVLKPELRKAHTVEVKPVEIKQVIQPMEIVLTSRGPKRPKEEIQAPDLGLSALPATVAAAANRVQTGGFGDPHAIPGPPNPNKAANINKAGSPNLPGGPGYGSGTGGAQGAHGTLTSKEGSAEGPKNNGAATGGATSGVAILSEPNPAYSSEARTLRLEGDVVLEVIFLASSQVQVVRVVGGLGHGLDEAAIQAAKQIHFRPAIRGGKPIDFPARVRISFRLAS